jgi:hypothetical protein
MKMRVLSAAVLAGFVWISGCRDGVEQKPVALASGTITCEGEPVVNASILFNPIAQGKSALVGRQAYANSDINGEFVLTTYGNEDGAVIGKHTVVVSLDSKEPCDCFAVDTVPVMEVEIKKGEKNHIDIVLPKKTGREPKERRSSSDDD